MGMEPIFILDRQERIVGMLKNVNSNAKTAPYFSDNHTEYLSNGAETFSFQTLAGQEVAQYITVGNYVAFKKDKKYKLFQIMSIEEDHEDTLFMSVYCEGAGLSLINNVVRARKLVSVNIRKFLEAILENTDWNIGMMDFAATQITKDINLEDGSAYSLLQKHISEFNCEFEFRIELENGRISKKYIDTYGFRGKVTGKRFEFGKDINKIKRTVDSTELATALIGVGKNDIKFTETVVEGIPKPAGQDFVADQEAYDRYNHNGYHLMRVFKVDTDSPEELLRKTWKHLQETKIPKISYEVDVAVLGELLGRPWEKISIGDTVSVIDNAFNPPIHLMARVSQLSTSKSDPYASKCVLSNFVEVASNITDEMRKLASELQGYVDKNVNDRFPIGGEDIKNDAIEGNHIHQNSITTDHLQAGSITAEKIEAETITADKIKVHSLTAEQIAANTITANEIKAETITSNEIKAGTIIGDNIAAGTITASNIKVHSLTGDRIAANTITANELEAKTITAEQIAAKTITANEIKAGTITGTEIKGDTITGDKIVGNTITGDKIAANSITAQNIVANTITGDKIAANTITGDKITGKTITGDKIAANSITANEIKVGTITGVLIAGQTITGDKIAANTIVGGNIQADTITGHHIKAGTITASNIKAGTITAESAIIDNGAIRTAHIGDAQITSAKIASSAIGNAHITDASISGAKIAKATITAANIANATIEAANIKSVNASTITTGTLDARNIKVINLNADSITTGSITVLGENLIHNSAFKNSSKWDGWGNWTIDSSNKFEGVNSVKISRSGITQDAWSEFRSEPISVTEGQSFVGSAYFKTSGIISSTLDYCIFALWGYKADGTRVDVGIKLIDKNISSYERTIITGIVPKDVTTLRLCFSPRRNGIINIAKPMLSKGTIASIWKEHNDELISDGAINTDKIGDNAVTAGKLNLEDLFVSNGAFVQNLQAVDLRAEQITTGKISSERLDITGLVGFEAFDKNTQWVFDTSGDKTYINGGAIYTNSVTADKINAKGLTITDNSNMTTFKIDDQGEVYVTGNIQSSNYDEVAQTGYKITKNGDAILNNALVRGDVILPNAGITNFGGLNGEKNYLLDSQNVFLNGSDFPNNTNREKGKITIITPNEPWNAYYFWNGFGDIKADLDIICSVDIKVNSNKGCIRLDGGNNKFNHGNPKTYDLSNFELNKWTRISATSKTTKEMSNLLCISGRDNDKGLVVEYRNFKMSLGKIQSDWTPAPEDKLNPVRFWAGSNYENRDKAPFRVYQDGSIYATKGNFEGTFSGSVDIGNIHISDTNTSQAVFRINTNNDTETKIFLSDQNSFVNTNFVFGTIDHKQIEFDVVNRRLNAIDTTVKINRSGNNGWVEIGNNTGVYSPMSIGLDKGQFGDYKHDLAFTGGGLIFNNVGARGSDRHDYYFRKKNGAERVKVKIDGTLDVDDDIVLGVMKIAKRTDPGNEGVDFII